MKKSLYVILLMALTIPVTVFAQDTEDTPSAPVTTTDDAPVATTSDAPVAAASDDAPATSDAPVTTTGDDAPATSDAPVTTTGDDAPATSDAPVAAASDDAPATSDAPVAAASDDAPATSDAPVAAASDDAPATSSDAASTSDGAAVASASDATDAVKGSAEASEESGLMPEANLLTEATLDKTLYEVRTRVDTLKEDTFTTKSRLLLLREEVLQRSVSGARLLIRHKDDMGGQYELTKVLYLMDNMPAFSRAATDTESIGDLDDQVVFDGITAPGTHQLTVQYVYRGKKWGVFSYMHNYSFVVESGYSFVVDEGKSAELVVTATERGDFFTPYEERPSISYAFEQFDLTTDSDTELQNGAGLSLDSSK